MDSIRVSEAPDPGSIPGEATKADNLGHSNECPFLLFSIIFASPAIEENTLFKLSVRY